MTALPLYDSVTTGPTGALQESADAPDPDTPDAGNSGQAAENAAQPLVVARPSRSAASQRHREEFLRFVAQQDARARETPVTWALLHRAVKNCVRARSPLPLVHLLLTRLRPAPRADSDRRPGGR